MCPAQTAPLGIILASSESGARKWLRTNLTTTLSGQDKRALNWAYFSSEKLFNTV